MPNESSVTRFDKVFRGRNLIKLAVVDVVLFLIANIAYGGGNQHGLRNNVSNATWALFLIGSGGARGPRRNHRRRASAQGTHVLRFLRSASWPRTRPTESQIRMEPERQGGAGAAGLFGHGPIVRDIVQVMQHDVVSPSC
jgi:hypothetical protein